MRNGDEIFRMKRMSDFRWEILIDMVNERVLSQFQLRYLDAKIDTLDSYEDYAELVEWFKEMPRIDDYQARPGVYKTPQGVYFVDGSVVNGSRRVRKLLLLVQSGVGVPGYEWWYSPGFIHEVDALHRLDPSEAEMILRRWPYPPRHLP